jgi:hypothetical protein
MDGGGLQRGERGRGDGGDSWRRWQARETTERRAGSDLPWNHTDFPRCVDSPSMMASERAGARERSAGDGRWQNRAPKNVDVYTNVLSSSRDFIL